MRVLRGEYPPADTRGCPALSVRKRRPQPIENPSQILREVCARVARLWQVPNLPQSVRYLLETFYQRRLDFSEEDLGILAVIENCLGKA